MGFTPRQPFATDAPELDNTDAVVLIPADGLARAVAAIYWSYSIRPLRGRLTIVEDGSTRLDLDIEAGGHDFLPFPRRSLGSEAVKGIEVRLLAGGVGCFGKLNVLVEDVTG
jgi:hypothetical protein